MKALIMKDLRAYTIFYVPILIVMLLYTYLCVRFGSLDGIIGFLVIVMPSFGGMVIFNADYELLPLIASMPVSRKGMVLGKYIAAFIIGIMLITFVVLIIWFLSYNYPAASRSLSFLLSPQGMLFVISPMLLIVSVCYPLLFRFGLRNGVKVVLGVFILTYGLGMGVTERLIQSRLLVPGPGIFNAVMALMNHMESFVGGSVLYTVISVMLTVLLAGSMILSVRFFQVKDIL